MATGKTLTVYGNQEGHHGKIKEETAAFIRGLAQLPVVGDAALGGVKTGVKAILNGTADKMLSSVTLGLVNGQMGDP